MAAAAQWLGALLVTLSLPLAALWWLKRRPGGRVVPAARLQVTARLGVARGVTLLVVECDGRPHLVMTGPGAVLPLDRP